MLPWFRGHVCYQNDPLLSVRTADAVANGGGMKTREQIESDLLAVFDKEIAQAELNAIMSSGGYCETACAGQRKATASLLREHVVAALGALRTTDGS